MDTYGSIYNNSFSGFYPSTNMTAYNDDGGGQQQFAMNIFINTITTYILVVTTYEPNIVGPFSIIGFGFGSITFSPIDVPSKNIMHFRELLSLKKNHEKKNINSYKEY